MHKSYKATQIILVTLISVVVAWRGCIAAEILDGASVAAKLPIDGAYGIQPGDILSVSVWKEPDLQAEVLVRPDGRLSFALAGDLQAAGLSIAELQTAMTQRLVKYIPDPVVTIVVKSTNGSRVYVVGKVNRPGEFALSRPLDIMQALSLAGGATPYAALNDIRVLRREGERQLAIKFRYDDVAEGRRLEQNILLKSGDTVVVP